MADDTSVSRRTGRDLLRASLPFVEQSQRDSWWRVGSTLVILAVLLACAAVAPWWPLRLAASIVGGLVIVRVFVLYHDFLHGALLPGSRLARGLFYSLGLLMLTPPRHWRSSHNFHHAHVGKVIVAQRDAFPVVTSDIGSFPLMSTESWQTATTSQRLRYRIARHPITILCAYVTVFLFIGCVDPLLKNPRKYWDGALSLIAHGGTIALLWAYAGFGVVLSAIFLPFVIASALGAYLFYAQHTFEGLRIFPAADWSYFRGALESSSYMKLGPIMKWFTGNIGYHHVHHLNPHVVFYRLPEAMAAIPELQHPAVTSLAPRDMLTCFRANLWDKSTQRMVSYGEAASTTPGPG